MKNKFLFGGSTSAFQFEGGYLQDGKGLATTDVRKVPEGIADTKVASDHYNKFKEDVKLMKELGLDFYRFSFSWSRIMPDGINVNQKGIDFYNHLIDLLIENDIQPFPTLYHFEMPQKLVEQYGGWKSRKSISDFKKYAEVCFNSFGDRVSMWGTINEQLIVSAASDLNGNHEEDPNIKEKNMYKMSYNMSLGEKEVIKSFRQLIPNGQIGTVVSMQVIYPETPDPKDILAAKNAEDFLQNMFLDMSVFGRYPKSVVNYLKKKDIQLDFQEKDQSLLSTFKPDFLGVNYYASTCIRAKNEGEDTSYLPPFFRHEDFTLGENNYLDKTEWMVFGIDPSGLYIGMRDLYERYHLPLIVTENGLAMSDNLENGQVNDSSRIGYLDLHLEQCLKLYNEGYPIIGYSPWSLFDIVSSHQGFSKRYGLIYVNRTDTDLKDLRRIPKDSFYWYKEKIKNIILK